MAKRPIKSVPNPGDFEPFEKNSSGKGYKNYIDRATGEIITNRTRLNSKRGQSIEAYGKEIERGHVSKRDAPNVVESGKPLYTTGFYTADGRTELHSTVKALDALALVPPPPPGEDQPIVVTILGQWDKRIKYKWQSKPEGDDEGREREVEGFHWKSVTYNRRDLTAALYTSTDLSKALQSLPLADLPIDKLIYGITFREGKRFK